MEAQLGHQAMSVSTLSSVNMSSLVMFVRPQGLEIIMFHHFQNNQMVFTYYAVLKNRYDVSLSMSAFMYRKILKKVKTGAFQFLNCIIQGSHVGSNFYKWSAKHPVKWSTCQNTPECQSFHVFYKNRNYFFKVLFSPTP